MHKSSYNFQGNVMGQCACGLFHSHQANSFSMLFHMQSPTYHSDTSSCPFISSSSSSSVDCTLSLGTPSNRLSNDIYSNNSYNNVGVKVLPVQHHDHQRHSNSYMPNFCWDILQPKNTTATPTTNNNNKSSCGGGTHMTTNISSGDPLLARRCANCDTTSTPLWRNGPRGPKSLCNACGIRFKKEERRATAAAASNNASRGGGAAGGIMESHYSNINNNAWVHHHQYTQQAAHKMPCFGSNEFRFMNDVVEDRDSESGIPFLSWRLNVTDRPSLVHDFT